MHEALLKTHLRNHADGESLNRVLAQIEKLNLSDVDCRSLQNCMLELCGNNVLYTPSDKIDHVYVEIMRDERETDRIKIAAHGVIDQPKWENLSKKVEFVRGKDRAELFSFRNKLLIAEAMSLPLSRDQEELLSTSHGSQGNSVGTITLAALARSPLSLQRGEQIGDGLFQFTLHFDLMLAEPLRHSPHLAPELGQPFIAG